MKPDYLFRVLRARLKIILVIMATTLATALLLSLLIPKKFAATVSVVADVKNDAVSGAPLPGSMISGYLATQATILSSRNVALRVVRDLKLADDAEARQEFLKKYDGKGSFEASLADGLIEDIEVKPSGDSNVIELKYTAGDPKFAQAVANAFAKAFIDINLEMRVQPAQQTAGWFDERMKALRQRLETAQGNLARYQQEKKIVATDDQRDVELARLSEISSQLVAAQGLAIESRSKERTARGLKGASADAMNEIMSQPTVVNIKAELLRAESKFQELSAQYGDNHPAVQQASFQVNALRHKLDDEVARVAKSLESSSAVEGSRAAQLQAALDTQRERVLEINRYRAEMSVLEREVDGAKKAYDAAMERYAQTSLEGQLTQTNISILNPAVEPTKPASPNLPLNMALAFVLGGMLGVGTAFALEYADRRIRGPEDIKILLDLPVLGEVRRDTHHLPKPPHIRLLPSSS